MYHVTVPFQSASSRVFASGIRERLPWWLVILAVSFSMLLPATAQEHPRITPPETENDYLVNFWRTTQGLPHNTVNALLQTRDGYVWVGTGSGVARFDGLVFTPIGQDMGLRDVVVTALLEDQKGGLWVGTQGKGVFRLLQNRVERYTGTAGLAGDAVTSLAEDSNGKVWIGTQNGLNYWDRGQLFRFQTSATRKDDSIVALHAGEAGALWVTTRSGVFRLQNGQAAPFSAEQLPQGRNAEFIGAYEDRAGNLWAFGATFLLNVTQGRSLNSFPSFSLTSSRVWTICEQGNGDFWIGTSGQGLFRFQNGRFEAVGGREGLEQCDIRALHADRWGNLWIGTGGNGLARLRTRRLRSIGLNEGLNSQRITAIANDSAGGLWVGSADTGLWHWNGTRAEQWSGGGFLAGVAQINSLCVDGKTNLWVGTGGNGIVVLSGTRQRRLTTADGLQDDQIRSVATARDGETIWVGTQAGTLHRIRGNVVQTCGGSAITGLGAITALLPENGETLLAGTESGLLLYWDGNSLARMAAPSALVGRPINCLFEDRRGRLWVCSGGAGAFCRQGDTWIPLTRKQGLASDYVQMITQADSGLFWLATDENLYKTKSAVVEAYVSGARESIAFAPALAGSELDGFKCARGWPAVAHGHKALWIACTTELLPLGQIENPGAEPAPPVILERVLINGQPEPLPENGVLKLGPGVRSVDFEFSAISFTAPQKVRFRHQLENFDSDWVETDVGRRAHYGPLPAGDYRFHVIAANAEGIWNETGASLGVIVIPPLWKSWWFLALTGIATTASIWAAARFISTRRLERRLLAAEQRHSMERERARIAQDMHDEIGSKLTRISFLSEIARGSAAGGMPPMPPIEAIATTSRELLQALDEIVWAVNPRNDNLEQLAGYLEQHAREYFQGTACDFQIEMPLQFPVVSLSAELRHNVFLAFEEALNNCLKHARAPKVFVAMRVQDDEAFEVQVQDEGRGFDVASNVAPEQDGLANMRDRLRSVGGTCEIVSQPGAGTTVIFRFPLGSQRNRHAHK